MEQSILVSTKIVLGLDATQHEFDHDIITHINAAFGTLYQLGVADQGVFTIDNDEAIWADFNAPADQLSMVKTYVFLKTREQFDPPTLRFVIDAMRRQITELEWRLNVQREATH